MGVAVKVTDVPAQIVVPGLAPIVTTGVNTVVIFIVKTLLVSEFLVRQFALLAIITSTWSPFASPALI